MKWLKWLLISLVLLIGGGLLVGLFLPDTVRVQRSILVDAPAARIFPYTSSMRRFNEWSPWYGVDPAAVYQFSGPDQGTGSAMRWSSDDPSLGEGAMTITASAPNRRVDMTLDFGAEGTAASWFELEEQAAGTEVTWGLEVTFGRNPVERYFGFVMDRLVGQEYEKGLRQLKQLVEA